MCSHEIKRYLLLGRKAMTNLDSILKSKDITLPTKVHLVKAIVYPIVMYGSESWTIKKAECQKVDAFELCCWRRLLRVPWTARRFNQSILKEISPEYSLEGLIMMLKLQSFGHLIQRTDPFEKTLMLGKIEGRRRRGRQGMRWMTPLTQWTWVWVNYGSWWWTGRPGVLQSMGCKESDTAERLNWTVIIKKKKLKKKCQVASVTSDSLQPSKLEPTVFLCPWGFSRLEYWIRLTCPSSGDLPYPGIERTSPALAGGFFAISATWEAPLPIPTPEKEKIRVFQAKGPRLRGGQETEKLV